MKKIHFLLFVFFVFPFFSRSQNIDPAPRDKSVVYFIRYSSLGGAMNFKFFDNTSYIGKINGAKYFRYECDPGAHVFWSSAENKSFIEAKLDTGKVYFIEVRPLMGAFSAEVDLVPVDYSNTKKMKKIFKLMNKKPPVEFTKEEIEEKSKDIQGLIAKGVKSYKNKKEDGVEFREITNEMYYPLSDTDSNKPLQ